MWMFFLILLVRQHNIYRFSYMYHQAGWLSNLPKSTIFANKTFLRRVPISSCNKNKRSAAEEAKS